MSLKVHDIPLGIAHAYLIESKEGLVLVDSGLPRYEQKVVHQMRSLA